MYKKIKQFIQFFTVPASVYSGLDDYINSQNPKSESDVVRMIKEYEARGICGKIQ